MENTCLSHGTHSCGYQATIYNNTLCYYFYLCSYKPSRTYVTNVLALKLFVALGRGMQANSLVLLQTQRINISYKRPQSQQMVDQKKKEKRISEAKRKK